MPTESAATWRKCFDQWPAGLERRGVLVVNFGEQIPFDGYATSEELLLVERRAPDTVGARLVLIPYHNIQALKIVDVAKLKTFENVGFTIPAPRK